MELSSQRILEVWEQGASVSNESRALSLLGLIQPELSQQAISELVLGERNNSLLDLHQAMFGSRLKAYVECSECDEALDLEYAINELGFSSICNMSKSYSFTRGSLRAEVRLPNSQDLIAVSSVDNVNDGRDRLFSRCILQLVRDDENISYQRLDEEELNQLEEAIYELDPRMEILFDLQCPECDHRWQSSLDIASYLWNMLDAYARRLLEDVHVLAHSYGWSEDDILRMSSSRRNYYL